METVIVNIIVTAIIVCVIAAVIFHLYREKKRGAKCVGCPYAKQCGGGCQGNCNSSQKNRSKDSDQ